MERIRTRGAAGGSGPGNPAGGGVQAGGGTEPSAGAGAANAGGPGFGGQVSADKLDVLFVIDNSLSMGGKQRVLASSLPRFVSV